MKTSLLVLLLVGVLSSGRAHAQQRINFDEFYTVKEPTANVATQETTSTPIDLFWDQVDEAVEWGSRVYSLLSFDHHQATFGNVLEPYNRMKHFGTWIAANDPQGRCGNTRAAVLRRDSSTNVTMSPSGCTVSRGTWEDPYTGGRFTDARDLQIDHFVPLKNAYISGADKWNKKKRCLYANYLGNKFHLLAVEGTENMRKSDRGPDGYVPPNRAYQCQYLAQWLKVKVIWSLGLTPPEKAAIEELVQDNHCTATELAYTQSDLAKQRRFIADNKDLCQ
ncbi:hypothetical protein AZI86_00095 [Bdellovibrio bacteriovorus]|uniref:GmrSD restriction endonucleases C-terminal domain-containing protein n=1 Tax=Bdellovibrio bacteriovorus TaxID=959 RepID=A0A150WM71_BDEBC|nr:HNH endonuclease family protein [Bdellovibrio bacteriovorus]KYG65516.1 hypothetical protein AZI86_00095 [Bdellovibrio bacteriovorus]